MGSDPYSAAIGAASSIITSGMQAGMQAEAERKKRAEEQMMAGRQTQIGGMQALSQGQANAFSNLMNAYRGATTTQR